MRHVTTPAVMRSAIVFATLSASLARTASGQGQPTREALVAKVRAALASHDSAALQALVYRPKGSAPSGTDTFGRVISAAFHMGPVSDVRIVPVPTDEVLEYTRDGVTYRPALPPIGQLIVTLGTGGNSSDIKMFVGQIDGRDYITLAAPNR
jgi:hypothetical protein